MTAISAPSGVVTLLFTDIEGSTKRWEALPAAMSGALMTHDLLLRSAIEAHGGFVFKTVGDAFCAAFADPADALASAVEAQRSLAAEAWGEVGHVRVRMALHTGEPEHRDRDYFGPPVNRVARLLSTGYGEQVLVSAATAAALGDRLPTGTELTDLGAHRLKDLLQPERIFQLVVPGLLSEFPPIKSLDRQPHNLPAQPTPLIGRDQAVAQVRDLITAPGARLVTLTGPGGIGKTRLALQAAADLVDSFSGGAWFAGMAPITDADLVIPTIAEVLGVREAGHEPIETTLHDYLRDKRLLLLLDNLEHVVAAAPSIGRLLTACRGVQVLATSRAVLRVYGEREFVVPALPLPDPKRLPPLAELAELPSVELFVERAKAIRPGFELTDDQAQAVAGICVRLDGLPLAIELAAARVRVLAPDKLLERLGKRLDVLTGGASDRDPRQQTLRGAIAWSHDLLPPGEQTLFRRLAAFAGANFEAIEAVCAGDNAIDALDGLDALVRQSLLRQEEGPEGPRFFMLESIREFAAERLTESGESDPIRARHAAWHLDLAEQAEPALKGPEQKRWLGRLESEHDNLRAALSWLAEPGQGDGLLRLAAALASFWYFRGHLVEGRRWLDRAIDGGSALDSALGVKAVVAAAIFAETQGEMARAVAQYEQALALARTIDDRESIARCLHNLGIAAYSRGDYNAAASAFEEALALNRELGDERGIAQLLEARCTVAIELREWDQAELLGNQSLELYQKLGVEYGVGIALENLGKIAQLFHRDYDEARRLYDKSLSVWRELDERQAIVLTLHNLGRVERLLGRAEAAEQLFREALDLGRAMGHKIAIGSALLGLGLVAHGRGEIESARRYFQESLTFYQDSDHGQGIALSLEAVGVVACVTGVLTDGVVLFGAAEALRESLGITVPADDRAEYDSAVAAARDALDLASFGFAWDLGRMLTTNQACTEAMQLAG